VSNCVLDSSAILAVLYHEPGQAVVEAAVREPGAMMSSVNLLEVVSNLADRGWSDAYIRAGIARIDFDAIPLDIETAFAAGLLRRSTRQAGLSLGDRACLALAQRLGVPAITADRAWTTLGLPITVQVIR